MERIKFYEVDASFAGPIQSALMFLTNVTNQTKGAEHLLGQGKQTGAILENLFGMFAFFKTNPTFDFASNILANVTALKEGREFIIEANLVK